MDHQSFIETLSWAEQKGLKVYPHMEHKCVEGIWGMYATADIPKHTVLTSYPISSNLPIKEDFSYPPETSELIKRIHAATLEYQNRETSEWHGLLKSVESFESLQKTSAYFLADNEMTTISYMNPLLHRIIQEKNAIITRQVQELCQLDPSLSRQDALVVALNFKTRAWSRGFLPIFDQFNTSEALGATVCENDTHLFFMSARDYKAGEQIWISYGKRDIYDYAIDYDFFDPNAIHSISFSARGSQFTRSQLENEIIHYAASKHQMDLSPAQGGAFHYQLFETDARILEHAPSSRLVEYILNTAFRSKEEFDSRQCSADSFEIRYGEILDALLSINQVDRYKRNELSGKLLRFYDLLKKEKQILLQNKEWLKFNSSHLCEIPEKVRTAITF